MMLSALGWVHSFMYYTVAEAKRATPAIDTANISLHKTDEACFFAHPLLIQKPRKVVTLYLQHHLTKLWLQNV